VSGRPGDWRIVLTSAAEADFDQILQWTAEHFGNEQAEAYSEILLAALEALKDGPTLPDVRAREDLPWGILTIHAARSGKKARHIILFRVDPARDTKTLQVLRILHDAMDLSRHVGQDDESDF